MVIDGNYGVYDGLEFKTTGAYGSRILDMDGPIYFAICDVCLLQRRHRILAKNQLNTEHTWVEPDESAPKIINGVEFYREWLEYV